MRKTVILLIIALIPLWVLSYVIAGKSEAEFAPDLQNILKEELQMNNFSKKAALSVEELDLSNYNLTSVDGLEQFKNLKKLDLSHNLLTDSSFLQQLPNLEEVDLSHNQFEKIDFKSNKIKELNVRGNLLKSIDFSEKLTNLTYFNIRDNHVEDLTPIQNNKQLTYVNIRGNNVRSIEPLASLPNLNNLNIRNNNIKSIEPLTQLPLNERLTLRGNNIIDLHLLEPKLATIDEIDFEIELAKPVFSKESGFFDQSFELEIETNDEYEIFYTLDGSTPNAQSHKYDKPIKISKKLTEDVPIIANHQTAPGQKEPSFEPEDVKRAVTIKAVAALKTSQSEAREFSDPVTATYIFDERLKKSNLPIISLSIDPFDLFDEKHGIYVPGIWHEKDSKWSGNFAQRGRDFEREATFELFDENKQLDIKQNVGVRINGRSSRRFSQKSLRIYARTDYGQNKMYTNIFDSLDYNKFDLFILRNSGQDFNSTLLRDGLMHELVKHLDVDLQAYQPAIVLINGEYWGIQNIRERLNDDYIVNKYNIDENDVILMKAFRENDGINFEVKSGPEQAKYDYLTLLDYVEEHDLNEEKHLTYVDEQIDIENYLYYVAYQIYYANTDSFSNNLRVWRKDTPFIEDAPKGHDGRWRWMFFDLDWGMGYHLHNTLDFTGDIVEFDMVEHVLKDERRMSLFRNLMKNEQVREQFIYIMMSLLNDEFSTENVRAKIDELAANIADEIPHSIKRWGNIKSVKHWEENIEALHDFAKKRPAIVKKHLFKKFNLTDKDVTEIIEKMSE